jgi:hypothetical protein
MHDCQPREFPSSLMGGEKIISGQQIIHHPPTFPSKGEENAKLDWFWVCKDAMPCLPSKEIKLSFF